MSSEESVFQLKYNEFVDDLMGAVPEYSVQIQAAKGFTPEERVRRFQSEVNINGNESGKNNKVNPGTVLPGVIISDSLWSTLSENTQNAIWEYLRILSMCMFMESGFAGSGPDNKPEWLEDAMNAMNEMKDKLKNVDFEGMLKKFMTFFKPTDSDSAAGAAGAEGEGDTSTETDPTGSSFFSKMPKLPEKFLKGHLAKLAEELVKDIKPEDLGMSPELMAECEKSPSRAFDILLNVFTNNPESIQQIVQKIGKRLQQKIMSGAIRPQEIAREAEELMKEFVGNSSFVDMMGNLKSAFGFEDMDLARAAGREGSARLSVARDRLRKKLEKKKQQSK